jgi:uncharacterized protein YlxP (DUF503 family)
MIVALLRLRLHIPGARSLKDRRAVVRRAVDRVRARFNVSAAEVGDTERWQVATLAAVVVSSDRGVVDEVLDKVSATVASAVAGEAMITARDVVLARHDDTLPLGDEARALGEKFGDEDPAS